MAAPTSLRFPDELRARIEAALGPREKFSAGVFRLIESGLAESFRPVDEDGIRTALPIPATLDHGPLVLPDFSAPRGGVEFRGPDPKPASDPGKKRRY